MKFSRLASIVIMSASLAGCDSAMDRVIDELKDRQRSWQRLGIDNYGFVMQESCFCPLEYLQAWRVTVRQDKVVSVASLEDGHAASASFNYSVRTIDWLFGRLLNHADGKDAIVEVDFDPQYSFPSRARMDTRNVLDGASLITITDFHVE